MRMIKISGNIKDLLRNVQVIDNERINDIINKPITMNEKVVGVISYCNLEDKKWYGILFSTIYPNIGYDENGYYISGIVIQDKFK